MPGPHVDDIRKYLAVNTSKVPWYGLLVDEVVRWVEDAVATTTTHPNRYARAYKARPRAEPAEAGIDIWPVVLSADGVLGVTAARDHRGSGTDFVPSLSFKFLSSIGLENEDAQSKFGVAAHKLVAHLPLPRDYFEKVLAAREASNAAGIQEPRPRAARARAAPAGRQRRQNAEFQLQPVPPAVTEAEAVGDVDDLDEEELVAVQGFLNPVAGDAEENYAAPNAPPGVPRRLRPNKEISTSVRDLHADATSAFRSSATVMMITPVDSNLRVSAGDAHYKGDGIASPRVIAGLTTSSSSATDTNKSVVQLPCCCGTLVSNA